MNDIEFKFFQIGTKDHVYIRTPNFLNADTLKDLEMIINGIDDKHSGKDFIFDYTNLAFCSPLGLSMVFIMHQMARNVGKVQVIPPLGPLKRTMLVNGIVRETELNDGQESLKQLIKSQPSLVNLLDS